MISETVAVPVFRAVTDLIEYTIGPQSSVPACAVLTESVKAMNVEVVAGLTSTDVLMSAMTEGLIVAV